MNSLHATLCSPFSASSLTATSQIWEHMQCVCKYCMHGANMYVHLCCLCIAKPYCQVVFLLHIHHHSCRYNHFASVQCTLCLTLLGFLHPLLACEQHAVCTQHMHSHGQHLINMFLCVLLF